MTTDNTSACNDNSSCYVSLHDIQEAFPEALGIKLNGHLIPFAIRPDGVRILPLSTDDETLSVITYAPPSSNQTFQDLVLSSPSALQSLDSSLITRNFEQVDMTKANLALDLIENKEMLQKMVGMQEQIVDLLQKAKIKDDEMLSLQREAKIKNDEMLALQREARDKDDKILTLQLEAKEKDDEMLTLQNQALDRLAILQKHAHAILVQNFELHEYPIPRLFIILPVDKSKWNPKNILENKFRLHFLCECGDHTMKASKSGQDQIHIARHEGYEIRNGTEFFCKYGKYMIILLRALKLGIHSVNESASRVPVQNLLDAGIDFSINYMEALSVNNPVLRNINTIDDYEALEGADLRQLDTFLQVNDANKKLGNLFRITTDTGHVKWVCIDHYNSTCQEKDQKAFENAVGLNGGKYDSQLGKVIIVLGSRSRAEEFFDALTKARHVYDLNITFDWDCTRADLEAFEYALKMSSVSILRLDLRRFQASAASKLLSTSTRYEVLVRIIEHTNMKVIHIVLSKDFIKLSSLEPRKSSHLHKLSLEMKIYDSIGEDDSRVLVNSLRTNTTLTTLSLTANSVKKEGALALSEVLKTNTTLTTLYLFRNSIGDEGTLALSEALKTNTTLTTLYLSNNSIGNDGALALSEALKTNTVLTILDLESNSIGKEGALALSEALKTNTVLITLDLSRNLVGNQGALTLSETLRTNTTLTKLYLSNNSIRKEGALALSEALKTNTTLTFLFLSNNSIGEEGVLALSEALKTNTVLITLDLSRNLVGNQGALALSEALRTNTTLTKLYLSNNLIRKEGALALSEALKANTTLTSLFLSNNSIGEEGVLALSEVLKTNTTLITLNLSWSSIGKEGTLTLSEALRVNTTLTSLFLSNNSIEEEGALILSEALKTNTVLITLDLGSNLLGNQGALALSEALKTNKTLTTLYLSNNSIGKDGAFALSEALKTNTTLTTLFLGGNLLEKNGALALSEALKTNPALRIY